MDRTMAQRGLMAGLGAVAGLCLYALFEIIDRGLVTERAALGLAAFGAVFFFALLGMVGPLKLGRAALGALGVGALIAGLLVMASLRFDTVEGFLGSPMPVLAAALLATIPLPFFIAASGPGWRDYPTLFSQSWGIVVRYAAAGLFTAVVWGVIYLSDTLLSIVGLTVIEDLLALDATPWVITGTVLGLALAVVVEFSELVSPYLVLRLLRLLLPVVLVVMTVFVLALPVQGVSGLLGGLSVAATLIAMAAAAATLVTTAVDQADDEAVRGPWMVRAAQSLTLLVPVFAGLAGWAVWQRVAQYGWTPERLFAALSVLMALGYGVVYLWAMLGRGAWMTRIRQGNIAMALVLVGLAAAWLTVLNPQAISARDQVARYEAGKVPVGVLDLAALGQWGRAGGVALTRLEARATETGDEALALRLKNRTAGEATTTDKRAALKMRMPVQPETAQGLRDQIVDGLPEWQLRRMAERCAAPLPSGAPGCVLVVGDFWTEEAGEEAMLLLRDESGGLEMTGLLIRDGAVEGRGAGFLGQGWPKVEDTVAMIEAAQAGAPVLTPMPLKAMRLGGYDLTILP